MKKGEEDCKKGKISLKGYHRSKDGFCFNLPGSSLTEFILGSQLDCFFTHCLFISNWFTVALALYCKNKQYFCHGLAFRRYSPVSLKGYGRLKNTKLKIIIIEAFWCTFKNYIRNVVDVLTETRITVIGAAYGWRFRIQSQCKSRCLGRLQASVKFINQNFLCLLCNAVGDCN